MFELNRAARALLIAAVFLIIATLPSGTQVGPEYGILLKKGPKAPIIRFPSIDTPAPPGQARAVVGDIAFVRDGDIYTVTIDGAQFNRLTADGCNAFPVWSPSGRHIAFSKAQKTIDAKGQEFVTASLWVITGDGRYSKIVAKAGNNEALYPAAWLPDSKGLLVVAQYLESDAPSSLKVVTLDSKAFPAYQKWIAAGKKAKFIYEKAASGSEFIIGQAGAFSPDKKKLMLTAATENFIDSARLDLYRMSVDGKSVKLLAKLPYIWIECLRWHPKSAKLLSAEEHYTPDKPYEAGIWIRDADGKVLKKLVNSTTSSFSGMDWSPDGNYIVYQMTDKEYPRFEHPENFRELSTHSSVWAMKADGTGKNKLSDNACQPNWR